MSKKAILSEAEIFLLLAERDALIGQSEADQGVHGRRA